MIFSLLFVIAFFLSLPVVEPYELARLAAVVLMAGGAGWVVIRALGAAEGWRLPRGAVPVLAGLFWLCTAVSVVLAEAWTVSFVGFCSFSLMPLAVLLLWSAPERKRVLRLSAAGAGLVLAGLALWAVGQYLFLPEMLVYHQVRVPFANPNSYAALLALGVIPALGMMITEEERRVRILCAALAFLLLVAVMVIGGRAVPLVLTGGMVVFLLMVPAVGWRVRLGAGLFFAAALAVGLALALAGGDHPAIMRGAASNAEGAALYGRWPIWQAAWAMISDHAWWGTGIGTFFLYYPQYRLPADAYSSGLMAHNDALQFWAEMGTAGILLFYAFIGAALWRMKQIWARRNVMAVALFCALGVLVVHSHFDFNLYVAGILSLAGLGLAWWLVESDQGEGVVLRCGDKAGALMIGVPLLAGFALLQALLLGEMQVKAAQALGAKGDLAGFVAAVNKADELSFGLNGRAYVLAATVPIGILQSRDDMAETEKEALRAQAEKLLARAERLNPRLVAIAFYRAQMAESAESAFYLAAALRLNPQHLPSRMMLADIWHRDGRKEEAYLLLREGLNWRYGEHDPMEFYEIVAARALIRMDQDGYQWAMARMKAHQPVATADEAGLVLH